MSVFCFLFFDIAELPVCVVLDIFFPPSILIVSAIHVEMGGGSI